MEHYGNVYREDFPDASRVWTRYPCTYNSFYASQTWSKMSVFKAKYSDNFEDGGCNFL